MVSAYTSEHTRALLHNGTYSIFYRPTRQTLEYKITQACSPMVCGPGMSSLAGERDRQTDRQTDRQSVCVCVCEREGSILQVVQAFMREHIHVYVCICVKESVSGRSAKTCKHHKPYFYERRYTHSHTHTYTHTNIFMRI